MLVLVLEKKVVEPVAKRIEDEHEDDKLLEKLTVMAFKRREKTELSFFRFESANVRSVVKPIPQVIYHTGSGRHYTRRAVPALPFGLLPALWNGFRRRRR